jgi:DNA repair exonuclease SbcCD nuclease subunit
VVVSPGNHDAFGPTSVWNRRAFEPFDLDPWPANVHIFESRSLSPLVLCEGDLAVYGHRVEGYHGHDDSPLSGLTLEPGPRWNVLLIHGSCSPGLHDDRVTLPFTLPQLATLNVDYVAAGHHHRFQPLVHEGRTLGAYAGIPVPGTAGEDPHGGVLVIELTEGEAPRIECIETFPGRVRQLRLDGEPPFEGTDEVVRRLVALATDEGVSSHDMVLVALGGFSRVEIDLDGVLEALRASFLALRLRDDTEPEGSDEAERGGRGGRATVESQFEWLLQERIKSCADPRRRERFQQALHYGRLALRGRGVRPPVVLSVEMPKGVSGAS